MSSIFIANARIIDPSRGVDAKGGIYAEEGVIREVTKKDPGKKADIEIDARGKIVCPGFIDMHTHLREPGREDKETVATGMAAAISGGFTTVCAMPNTEPPCDSAAHASFLIARAREAALGRLVPIGTLTRGRKGLAMSDMGELKEAGCPALSDDGDTVQDSALMRRIFEYAAMLDLLVISHCEDTSLSADGVMTEGYWSTMLGMTPIPRQSEINMVERDIRLAELTGVRLHIAHVSARESVDVIKAAKNRGAKVSAEVTPHHFSLTDEAVSTYDSNTKVKPPLGTAEDAEALRQGLKEGVIDAIATDHAPHTENEKEREYDHAPFGMIGLETALSLGAMELVEAGYLDWPGLISKLTEVPARLLGITGGTLAPGSPADITVIDPLQEWTLEKKMISSRSKNTPFIGHRMRAKVTDVIAGGRPVFRDGLFTSE